MQSTDPRPLEQVSDGLFASPPAPVPFGVDLLVRAFLIQRADGNLLVYNAPGLTSAAREIAHLGGAVRQVVNHSHEAVFGPQEIEAPLFVHERDQPETTRSMPVAGTLSVRQAIGDDFEVIPTPGHTPGTTAFLWDNGHPPLPVHRRHPVEGARPMVRGRARLERSHRVPRQPGCDARVGLRRARAVGGRLRRAVRRVHEQTAGARPHRCGHCAGTSGSRPLKPPSLLADAGTRHDHGGGRVHAPVRSTGPNETRQGHRPTRVIVAPALCQSPAPAVIGGSVSVLGGETAGGDTRRPDVRPGRGVADGRSIARESGALH